MNTKIFLFFNLFILLSWQNLVQADHVPMLRLETGMHSAQISNIDVDKKEQFLVTGSHDKTVRLWSLSDGKLLRVLRPPIGEGNEGKIYTVAISPDGNTIAVGGWTDCNPRGNDCSIYLFDRATGELRQRIQGHPNVIHHLAYSHDGQYLVASLHGGNGIRIYRTSDYGLEAQDTEYADASYWAEFDKTGRLVTSCYDGYIRLYDNAFNLLKKHETSGGSRPFAVRFSPDGSKIALGFVDSTQITVLSAKDLSELYRPDTLGINNGSLSSIAWSQNGDKLYAGGMYWSGSSRPILHWSQAGQGNRRVWSASLNTIMGIQTLKNGEVIFGTFDPTFGRFSDTGEKMLYREADIADFRDNDNGFLISQAGDVVQFGYEVWGKHPARFSLDDRVLNLNPSAESNLSKPKAYTANLNITDWKHHYSPKLNGKILPLEQYEMSRSVAIAPDEQHFLLGADWYLRLFDKNGNQQWKKPAPSAAWGVNISGNGKLAVAAFGDGTIRWYRLTDGEELLAFFPHKDGKRWVIWTPQGYYAASAGGDELIGWHVNRGQDKAADFFPASQFRERYYRPDVIAEALNALDSEQALVLASENKRVSEQNITEILPPVVTLLSPQEGDGFSNTVLYVRYRIRNPSDEPVTELKILLDGQVIGTKKQVFEADKEYKIPLPFPRRDVSLALIATNRYTASVPAIANLQWQGSQSSQEFDIKPKLYVLAIGISNYDYKKLTLRYSAKDAQDFTAFFKSQKDKGLYRDVEVKLLADASKNDILEGLDWIERQTTQHDVAMVFFSGHGANDRNNYYYFLPRDTDIERIKLTGVPYHAIKNTVTALAGKALFFIDTCHAGNVLGARGNSMADVDNIANDLASAENGIVVFASSTGRQNSYEREDWGNGAFTKAVLEGLNQSADYTKDGAISINELDLYISERVKTLTKGDQTPTTSKPKTVPNFPIAVTE